MSLFWTFHYNFPKKDDFKLLRVVSKFMNIVDLEWHFLVVEDRDVEVFFPFDTILIDELACHFGTPNNMFFIERINT